VSVLSGVVPLDPGLPGRMRTGLGMDSADGRWRIGWSGRIDNRSELVSRFTIDPTLDDGRLMAEVIAAGGVGAIGQAIGDFALAAWDSVDGCLWLARDAIGFRPLFYREERGPHGTQIRFATALGPFGEPGSRPEANPGFIAEVLAGLVVSGHETALAGVFRVLPAEALRFRAAERAPRRETLWRPPTVLPPRRSDADLIDECRERFFAAESASICGSDRVSAQLSGGLDSSAVVAAARDLRGAAPDTYSIVYPTFPRDADGELIDESPFIDAVTAATGARSVRFEPLAPGAFTARDLLRVTTSHGDVPYLAIVDALNYPLFTRAAADGHTAMLTGLGGDFWLTGSMARLPWLLRRGQLGDAWRFFRAARHPETLNASLAQFSAHLVTAFTPDRVRAAYRRRRPARSWPDWIPAAFAGRVQLAERLRRLSDRVPKVDDDVLQDSLRRLSLAEGLLTRETLFRAADDAGISVRHPMLDRRFVEFAITLPDDLRMRGGEIRYIFRRALSGVLPEEIRVRRSKGDATIITGLAISRLLGGRMPAFERAAARGWLDASRLAPSVAPFLAGDPLQRSPRASDDQVLHAVAVELWLQNAGA
jgi:asparagine synthase (glutamine-hydrolysing)